MGGGERPHLDIFELRNQAVQTNAPLVLELDDQTDDQIVLPIDFVRSWAVACWAIYGKKQ